MPVTDIKRLKGDELSSFGSSARIYQVKDTETIQGVYYLVVDPSKNMMSVVSVNLNGNYDEIDGIIIAGKVSSRASFGDSNITWKGDLGTLLPELLGNNSAIIMQDLKIPVDKSTYDLAMKTGDDDQDINISLSTNADDIDIRSFDFDFDPEISDPDEELGSPQGDDMGGDEDFADFMNDMDVGDEEEIDSDIEGDVEPDEENPQDEG